MVDPYAPNTGIYTTPIAGVPGAKPVTEVIAQPAGWTFGQARFAGSKIVFDAHQVSRRQDHRRHLHAPGELHSADLHVPDERHEPHQRPGRQQLRPGLDLGDGAASRRCKVAGPPRVTNVTVHSRVIAVGKQLRLTVTLSAPGTIVVKISGRRGSSQPHPPARLAALQRQRRRQPARVRARRRASGLRPAPTRQRSRWTGRARRPGSSTSAVRPLEHPPSAGPQRATICRHGAPAWPDPRRGPAPRRGRLGARRDPVPVRDRAPAAAASSRPTTPGTRTSRSCRSARSRAPTSPRSARAVDLHPDFGSNLTYGIPYAVVPATPAEGRDPLHRLRRPVRQGPLPDPAGRAGRGRRRLERRPPRARRCRPAPASSTSSTRAHPNADGSWNAGSGAVFNLRSNQLRPNGWTSADAAGLPIFAGLIRYDEIQRGYINHAIRFTAPQTQAGFIHPATHFASSSSNPDLPPMGLRLRLKASFDISPLPARRADHPAGDEDLRPDPRRQRQPLVLPGRDRPALERQRARHAQDRPRQRLRGRRRPARSCTSAERPRRRRAGTAEPRPRARAVAGRRTMFLLFPILRRLLVLAALLGALAAGRASSSRAS